MNRTGRMRRCLPVLLLIAGLAAFSGTWGSNDTAAAEAPLAATVPGTLYLPSADPLADLDAGMALAKKNGKRLLVVLGANWCHDSRALAARLNAAPLSEVIDSSYETLFVDVAYLETGREVITRLGIPVYYATPTVLIVEPSSGEIVNAHDRHQWGEAASIGADESVEYFRQFANSPVDLKASEEDIELQVLMDEIAAFEQTQADRLYQAYAVIGPMLKAYKEGDKDAFSEKLWNEVRDYRLRVPLDIEALRADVRERAAAGENDISLNYPVYPAFSWEHD